MGLLILIVLVGCVIWYVNMENEDTKCIKKK